MSGRLDLKGMRAIVTGASSGIGEALIRELASHGVSIVMVARRGERLDALREQLDTTNVRLVPLAGDITDAAIRQQAIQLATEQLGGLDLLVNNAGISVQGEFASGRPEHIRRVFEVNFFAAVELTRLALPMLRHSQRPVVVNLASILAHRAVPFNSEYCASKFALRGWSDAVRAEWAKWGIRVLVVSPGTTKTEFFDNLLEKRRKMPWSESAGVSPSYVARCTVQALIRRKSHIVPNWRGRLLLAANRYAPRLVNGIMRRFGSTDEKL
jgi:short-subunit dehydrogenase